MFYKMKLAGLERDLPLCKVNDELYIGAFVIFGDVELTCACAAPTSTWSAACWPHAGTAWPISC